MPDDYGEVICGACEEGDDCPIHETGRYARPVEVVIDCRPVPPAIQRLLDEVKMPRKSQRYDRCHNRHNRS
jgi:hypothetical protein